MKLSGVLGERNCPSHFSLIESPETQLRPQYTAIVIPPTCNCVHGIKAVASPPRTQLRPAHVKAIASPRQAIASRALGIKAVANPQRIQLRPSHVKGIACPLRTQLRPTHKG